MLGSAVLFFVLAVIAAVFGFGPDFDLSGGVGIDVAIAQVLFFVFLVLFVVSSILGMARREDDPGGPY